MDKYLIYEIMESDTLHLKPQIRNFLTNNLLAISLPEDINQSELDILSLVIPDLISTDASYKLISTKQPTIREYIPNNLNSMTLQNFYHYLSSIIVRAGTIDEFTNIDISNYTGKIVDFFADGDDPIFFIEWDLITLNKFSKSVIDKLLNKGISPFVTFLSSQDLLPGPIDLSYQRNERKQFEHLFPGQKIFEGIKNSDSQFTWVSTAAKWELYFSNLLSLYSSQSIICVTKQRKKIKLKEITGSDDKLGVWCVVETENNLKITLLQDILRILSPMEINLPLKQYKYWAKMLLAV
ncbi:MAG: hypothetical protein CVU39_02660 [Chloroflexi bacterium HGW-Chloroflexi-10]|nr:MAG: hypothetical protein CVU39_02660 [Chloroflexi bacterium HGW-Chloroflexi-10]